MGTDIIQTTQISNDFLNPKVRDRGRGEKGGGGRGGGEGRGGEGRQEGQGCSTSLKSCICVLMSNVTMAQS